MGKVREAANREGGRGHAGRPIRSGQWVENKWVENKKALCGNRRPSNDCLPYEKSLKDRCCFAYQPHKDKN
jgi:hypothetical protein